MSAQLMTVGSVLVVVAIFMLTIETFSELRGWRIRRTVRRMMQEADLTEVAADDLEH